MNSPLSDMISGKPAYLHILIIILLTACIYAVSLGNGFVLDDELIIVKNPHTLSLKSIPDVFFAPDVIKPYYRPLNRASYLIDYQLAGMNPAWYHGVNVLIHIGCAVLLYQLAILLTGSPWASLLASLLFALHPVNSEAVNFISARNTLMSAFFSLASLLAFLKNREQGKQWPLLSALLFFCALLSKETGLMVIAVIAFYSVFPVSPSPGQTIKDRFLALVPYLVICAAYVAMRSYSLHNAPGAETRISTALLQRLSLNFYSIPYYLDMFAVPHNRSIFHSISTAGKNSLFFIAIFWCFLVSAVFLLARHRKTVFIFGLIWFAVQYVPISNIVPIPSDAIAERFMYLPGIGIFVILAALTSEFEAVTLQRILTAALCAALLLCGYLTFGRNREWKDDYTLFASAVRVNPGSAEARYYLGTSLQDRGNIPEARRQWQTALNINPEYSDALIQMGSYFAVSGDLNTAENYYQRAIKAPRGIADPDKAMAYYNLGMIYEKRRQTSQAVSCYKRFLTVVPLTYEEYVPPVKQRLARLLTISGQGGTDGKP